MPKARKTAKTTPAVESLVTAVHIGASSVSMMVAERTAKGALTPVDFLLAHTLEQDLLAAVDFHQVHLGTGLHPISFQRSSDWHGGLYREPPPA